MHASTIGKYTFGTTRFFSFHKHVSICLDINVQSMEVKSGALYTTSGKRREGTAWLLSFLQTFAQMWIILGLIALMARSYDNWVNEYVERQIKPKFRSIDGKVMHYCNSGSWAVEWCYSLCTVYPAFTSASCICKKRLWETIWERHRVEWTQKYSFMRIGTFCEIWTWYSPNATQW